MMIWARELFTIQVERAHFKADMLKAENMETVEWSARGCETGKSHEVLSLRENLHFHAL